MAKKRWYQKHWKALLILAVILLIILSIFGTKLWLWLNFMLGNDMIITLTTDQENLQLANGEEGKINFEVKVQTNPFCQAQCLSEFKDISHQRDLDDSAFTIRPGVPFKREYGVIPYDKGSGKELYYFSVTCQSQKTNFCHTSGENITRSLLITVSHELNTEEQQLKQLTGEKLLSLAQKQAEQEAQFQYLTKLTEETDKVVQVEFSSSFEIKQILAQNKNILNQSADKWIAQDYPAVNVNLKALGENFQTLDFYSKRWDEDLSPLLTGYHQLSLRTGAIQEQWKQINNITILDSEFILVLNQTIPAFNHKLELVNQRNTLIEKQQFVLETESYTTGLNNSLSLERNKETLKKELTTNINKDILCNFSSICAQHLEAKEYLKTLPELSLACQQQQEFLMLLKDSLNSLKSGSYSYTTEFNASIKNLLEYLQYQQAQKYLAALSVPRNSSNGELLLDMLGSFTTKGNNTFDPSLSLALVQEMIQQQEVCLFISPNFAFAPFNLMNISVEKVLAVKVNLTLNEPVPRCPIYGKEQPCCLTQECLNTKKNIPLLFLHGHAFNKEISTEYSLNAFNQLQGKLIKEGYVSAGAISEYNYNTDDQGVWKVIPAPFTFKGSYYYDFFTQGSNYQLVQTKSENIDTYAIRLKDMIDWVKYKTGRPKVIIVAHSMGGLVARRYLQIFGSENVEKLIMIGTPNYGIVGNVADYCPIVGEQLECRDMDEESLFLNKLNRESLPQIPIYNIVGTGCDTDGEEGDGIVLKEKVELLSNSSLTHNYYVNGNCSGTDFLHGEMLNVNAYPEVYEIVKEAVSG